MKEALESTPEDCTEQSLAGHLDMQRGGFKEYGMVRGDMQDALAELYLWYRCRQTADKPAVDKCNAVLVKACKMSGNIHSDELIRLNDNKTQGHTGLLNNLYIVDSVFLRASDLTVSAEFDDAQAEEHETAQRLLSRIESVGIALNKHQTGNFARLVLDKWATIIIRIYNGERGAACTEDLVNSYVNEIKQYSTISSLADRLRQDTRACKPLFKPAVIAGSKRGLAAGAEPGLSANQVTDLVSDAVQKSFSQLQLSPSSPLPAPAAAAAAPFVLPQDAAGGGVGGNQALGITAEMAQACFAKFGQKNPGDPIRVVLGAMRVTAIAATNRVRGFKGCHPTFHNPSREDGKWGWACGQCASDSPREPESPLEDVNPKDSEGKRVDMKSLLKHQKLTHDQAYCRVRWQLVKAHVTANPDDRWMCVPLPDKEYSLLRKADTPA